MEWQKKGRPFMFTYAEAESLLAKAFGVSETVQRGAFRGRLKHLKRLNVPLDSSPGRGKKVLYDPDHLFQWHYCLEVSSLGMDPTLAAHMLHTEWARTMRFWYASASVPGPIYGYVRADFLSSEGSIPGRRGALTFGGANEKMLREHLDNLDKFPPRIGIFRIDPFVRMVAAAAARKDAAEKKAAKATQ